MLAIAGAAALLGRDAAAAEQHEKLNIVLLLADDIGEKRDLAKAIPEQVEKLHQKLLAWRKQVDAPMPKPNPKYDPDATSGKAKKGRKGKSRSCDRTQTNQKRVRAFHAPYVPLPRGG